MVTIKSSDLFFKIPEGYVDSLKTFRGSGFGCVTSEKELTYPFDNYRQKLNIGLGAVEPDTETATFFMRLPEGYQVWQRAEVNNGNLDLLNTGKRKSGSPSYDYWGNIFWIRLPSTNVDGKVFLADNTVAEGSIFDIEKPSKRRIAGSVEVVTIHLKGVEFSTGVNPCNSSMVDMLHPPGEPEKILCRKGTKFQINGIFLTVENESEDSVKLNIEIPGSKRAYYGVKRDGFVAIGEDTVFVGQSFKVGRTDDIAANYLVNLSLQKIDDHLYLVNENI